MIDPLPYALLAREAYHPDHYDIDVGAFRAILRNSPLGPCMAIAGTDDVTTALADAEALLPRWSPELNVWAPLGFLRAVEGAWPEIRALKDYGRSPKIIAAHSLGGPLALITAAMLRAIGLAPDAVLAFAPARSIPGSVLAGIQLQLYRLGEDEVPNLPPEFPQPSPLIRLGRATSLLVDHDINHIIAALGGAA